MNLGFFTDILSVLMSLGPAAGQASSLGPGAFPNLCPEGFTGARCEIECGLTFRGSAGSDGTIQPSPKIVGGRESSAHSWPWAGYIGIKIDGDVWVDSLNRSVSVEREVPFLCGATLIDLDTVVTATHCIIDALPFRVNQTLYAVSIKPNDPVIKYYVYLGVHDRREITAGYTDRVEVRRVAVNEQYHQKFYLNDIAVLKLSREVQLGPNIQVACLPSSSDLTFPRYYGMSVAIGWGETYRETAHTLREVALTIYSPRECRAVSPTFPKNWQNQICAGEFQGGKDTCQGDSGGGLFVMDNVGGKSKYTLAGITSYGDACALRGKPGIYTKVGAYLNWIEQKRRD